MEPAIIARLESVADRMDTLLNRFLKPDNKNSTISTKQIDSLPQLILLLDEAVNEKVERFNQLSEIIGNDVARLGAMTKKTFEAQRNFLWMACGRERPDVAEFQELVKEIHTQMKAFSDFKDSNRSSKFNDHLCAVEAAALGFGWIAQPEKPAPFVKESIDVALFYINRVLINHKGKDDQQFEWAKTLKELWLALHEYVKTNHTTGLVWNSQPGAKPVRSSFPTVKHTGVPPPPPPPPPPSLFSVPAPAKSDNLAALLESLNTGLDATSRLKKVSPDMQTHKNPSLRANSKVSGAAVLVKPAVSAQQPSSNTYEPRIFWDGKIWKVDYQVGNMTAVVEVTNKKESIYIYKCSDSIIRVKGKANAITLDSCRQTCVVFDGLVAQCEIINSQSIQVQTLGELPTVSIQKTDGCHVYLSREAQRAQIVASKSSEMNISAQLDDDDEYTELAIPEQFVTVLHGKKLITQPSEIV